MPAGHFDPLVMHNASSWQVLWAEGLTKYKEDKAKPLFDGPTPKPQYITHYYKKREETTVNPITQKYTDKSLETFVSTLESTGVAKTLNHAWDKQILRESHFDIVNHQPKLGHIHEVPYIQKLKPPSLITATKTGHNIISTIGLDEHHWAPPGKRPDRIKTPVRCWHHSHARKPANN